MTTAPNFRISSNEYASIKSFVERCWAKYPQFKHPEFENPPLSIEIDEDSNAPIGALCWFINRKSRRVTTIVMNQSPRSFEKEFVAIFNAFKLHYKEDTDGTSSQEKMHHMQRREGTLLLPHESQNLQEMYSVLKTKTTSPFGNIPKEEV